MTKKQLEATLVQFLKSPDFEQGVISATKAGWTGSGYSVELLREGVWRVFWDNEIGNLYVSPGIILQLPEIEDDDAQEYIDAGLGTEDDFLHEAFLVERADLEESLLWGLRSEIYS
jgi:hypothetical protein